MYVPHASAILATFEVFKGGTLHLGEVIDQPSNAAWSRTTSSTSPTEPIDNPVSANGPVAAPDRRGPSGGRPCAALTGGFRPPPVESE